jgi:sugar O-acyltransferase (sialic acid O-acetyltransferase NeuD family)
MVEMKLIVFGAGGHGRVVAETAENAGWTITGFIDDKAPAGTKIDSRHRVLGNREWLSSLPREGYQVALGIGDNYTRGAIALYLESLGFAMAIIISSSAVVSPSAQVGMGTVVLPGAIINSNATIGKGAIINSGAVVEHDSKVGEYAHLSPRSTLGGGAEVGEFTQIGIGSSILPLVSVGRRGILGAGAVATRSVPDDVVAFGVPARVQRSFDVSALSNANNARATRTMPHRAYAPAETTRSGAPSVEPWPSFEPDEIDAATRVLRSGKVNYWTGNEGKEFEKEFAEYAGTRHAIALANGTLALELALKVLGIGPGDDVVTSPRTFIASASSAVSVGARPIFADVDRESQNITAETIKRVLTPATKAIIAVHLAGWPCEMDAIMSLAREKNLKVIEDCAQAHGASYKGRLVGSIGDIGAFSFCQDKIMTTAGEGGMITLNSTELFEQAWAYKDHGKDFDAVFRQSHAPGFRWLHKSFGTNWRITEIQSAIGRLQLRKLSKWVDSRRKFAGQLQASFAGLSGLRVATPPKHIQHSYYKYYAFVRPDALRPGWNRDRIVAEINARGIQCFQGSCSEIYLEDAFPAKWRPAKRLTNARELGETSLMFLVHPTLTPEYIDKTQMVVSEVIRRAAKLIEWTPSRYENPTASMSES